jgi:DDE family transposase
MSEKPDKIKYHVRNWKQYDKALVQRGSLTVWIENGAIETWLDMNAPARRGRPRTYSDIAIECMMTLREVYRLPNRAAEGLTRSIMELLGLELPAADHTTLSRRGRRVCLKFNADEKRVIKHLVIDSTGLKVFGEGEWKVRSHGKSKRRTWRKLHLSIDAETGQITAAVITDNSTLDRKEVSNLLDQTPGEIENICADGAYDYVNCYGPIENRGATPLIPPRSNAVIRNRKPFEHRDHNLRHIRKLGMKEWKKHSGYHKRSLAETGIFRLKTIFDDGLNARRIDTQSSQALIRCLALNRMTDLGMPDSYPVL